MSTIKPNQYDRSLVPLPLLDTFDFAHRLYLSALNDMSVATDPEGNAYYEGEVDAYCSVLNHIYRNQEVYIP